MITFEEIREYLITHEFLKEVSDFILPESELYTVILLDFSLRNGLSVDYIDIDKLRNIKSYELKEHITGDGPIERCFSTKISLDNILKEGKSFKYIGIVEPIGLSSLEMNTYLILSNYVMYLEEEWNIDLPDFPDSIITVNDLLTSANELFELAQDSVYRAKVEESRKPKKSWWRFW